MNEADRERDYWEERAQSFERAREAIAADPAAWDGDVLDRSLDLICAAINADCMRILDLGCGAGRLTIPLACLLRESRFVGVDISAGMLKLAAERTPASLTIEWLLGDGRGLPAEVGRIDAAYSMITLQHIPRPAQAAYLVAVAERLNPDGVFRFQVLGGREEAFLWHCVDESWIRTTCTVAGLEVREIDRMRPFNNAEGVEALWVTAVKP